MAVEQQHLEKPKRAKTAYWLFCEVHRPAVMEANRAKNGGKLKMTELSKELTELWAKIDATEKAKFEALAAEEKEKHEAAMKEYAESQKIDGLMKKPQSSYFQFINANRETITKEHNLTDFGALGKKAAELWSQMTEAEKKPYVDKYEKDKAEYEVWKETPEGKEALAKLKGQQKEKKDLKRKRVDGNSNKQEQTADAEDQASPAKKVKAAKVPKEAKPKTEKVPKEAKPKTERKPKATAKPKTKRGSSTPELSPEIHAKCVQMGNAESGASYKGLLEKILATNGLAEIDQEKALDALTKHRGLLNKARSELFGGDRKSVV